MTVVFLHSSDLREQHFCRRFVFAIDACMRVARPYVIFDTLVFFRDCFRDIRAIVSDKFLYVGVSNRQHVAEYTTYNVV